MATYYVRKDRALDGSEGPPDASGLFYWFDGSDAAATDPDAVWTDETNTDDSDTTTVGYTTTTGASDSNEVFIEGTNAPASGGTISSVEVAVYYGPDVSGTQNVRVWTDSKGESLVSTNTSTPTADAWHVHGPALTTPSGGWTWAKVQALEVALWLQSGARADIGAVGVVVHTTVEGESTTNPFRTIDDAANTVAAADTVYVGAGTYRETVTMDTSGSSGSEIKFIADIDGSQTGDAGLVVISAFDDSNDAARTSCWDPDGKTFVEVYDFVMQGGTTAVVYSPNATNDNYEGVIFDGCVFVAVPDNGDRIIQVDMNAATTPTAAGLIIRNCAFLGGIYGVQIQWDQNASAEQDLKATIESCVFVGQFTGVNWDLIGSNTHGSGGLSITNCSFIGQTVGVQVDNGSSTTYPVNVRNSSFIGTTSNALSKITSNDGALTSDYNTVVGTLSNVTAGPNDRVETSAWLLGGIADLPLYRKLGWSPYLPFEPMRPQNDADWTSVIGDADSSVAPATDLYGNPRPMSQAGTTQSVYYFDGSDAAASDPGGVWTNETNFDDGSISTSATTTTVGSISADYIMVEGTNAPASGGTISDVEFRIHTGALSDIQYTAYTDGWSEVVRTPVAASNQTGWTSWLSATAVPSGGWTWAKVAALEIRVWCTATPDNADVTVAQIRVTHAAGNNDDRGAVEGRARPEQETTTVRTGSNAIRFEGAGYHDFLVPVAAQSTTITVYGRYDSNHTGSLPKMEVLEIPGVADKTDTMVAAANTWEQLTSGAFTPTAAGVCRVRVTSQDTSDDGRAFFDDLEVT